MGRQAIGAGALLLALGHGLLIGVVLLRPAADAVAWMLPVLLLEGAGIGMVMAPLVSVVLAGVPAAHAGVAAGVLATTQQMGNSLGVALIGILFYAGRGAAAFEAAMLALMLLALAVALLFQRMLRMADRGGAGLRAA